MHQISAISGNTITFNSPLTISYRGSHQAQLYNFTAAPTTNAGVESMTLSNGDDDQLIFQNAAYCWAWDVTSTSWLGDGIDLNYAFRVQLENVYVHNGVWPVNGGGGYAISSAWGSSENLIENSIALLVNKVIVERSSGAGSVVAYNYMDDGYINGSDGWVEIGVNGSHMVGSHHTLFEGNYGFNADSDQTHGNAIYHTYFRNYFSGFRRPFTALDGTSINDATNTPAGVGPLRAAGAHAYAYWMSFVGNVFGTPGQMSGWTYNCISSLNNIPSKCILGRERGGRREERRGRERGEEEGGGRERERWIEDRGEGEGRERGGGRGRKGEEGRGEKEGEGRGGGGGGARG